MVNSSKQIGILCCLANIPVVKELMDLSIFPEKTLKEATVVNKTELVANVAETAGLTKKDAEKAVNALFTTVQQALIEGDKIQIIGFGTFEVKERAARTGRNPRTGEDIKIPASKNPVFKAGKALKDAVN